MSHKFQGRRGQAWPGVEALMRQTLLEPRRTFTEHWIWYKRPVSICQGMATVYLTRDFSTGEAKAQELRSLSNC